MTQLSVIMPLFNAMPWLEQAVASVLTQEGPSLELLILDDGSSDGSYERAEAFARKDSRVRLARSRGPRGQGSSRNEGMAMARGDFLFFVDGDDVLQPGALQSLHERIVAENAPMAAGRGLSFCQQRWQLVSLRAPSSGNIDNTNIAFAYPPMFWLHLFRKSFLEAQRLRFPEDLRNGEDTLFLACAYACANTLAAVDRPVYLYRLHHKPASPSPEQCTNKMLCASRVVEAYRRLGKPDWVAPFITRYLINGLPGVMAVPAMADSSEVRQGLLSLGCEMLRQAGDALPDLLEARLGDAGKALYEALAARDDAAFIRQCCDLYRPAEYMVYHPWDLGGFLYRAPRRVQNWLRSAHTRETVAYLRRLQRCAESWK